MLVDIVAQVVFGPSSIRACRTVAKYCRGDGNGRWGTGYIGEPKVVKYPHRQVVTPYHDAVEGYVF